MRPRGLDTIRVVTFSFISISCPLIRKRCQCPTGVHRKISHSPPGYGDPSLLLSASLKQRSSGADPVQQRWSVGCPIGCPVLKDSSSLRLQG
ncbi:hypothetical protein ElyMa_002454200 [Elysia marginata]|uniref:Uncharacterized protein n=1 Tax=Elysia marginata TaxID=1093978 RepID=A0AAV4GLM4_9GAST|nr:hypothetical protein ElyMa_002454200 [Elysia marginata]